MKDRRIKDMLFALEQALGRGAFDVVDHWKGDLAVVGVADPRRCSRLVYIAAVADGLFDAVLEDAADSGSKVPYVTVGSHYDLGLPELIHTVRRHLA